MKSHQSSGRWAIKKIIIPLYPACNESVGSILERVRIKNGKNSSRTVPLPTFRDSLWLQFDAINRVNPISIACARAPFRFVRACFHLTVSDFESVMS